MQQNFSSQRFVPDPALELFRIVRADGELVVYLKQFRADVVRPPWLVQLTVPEFKDAEVLELLELARQGQPMLLRGGADPTVGDSQSDDEAHSLLGLATLLGRVHAERMLLKERTASGERNVQ